MGNQHEASAGFLGADLANSSGFKALRYASVIREQFSSYFSYYSFSYFMCI